MRFTAHRNTLALQQQQRQQQQKERIAQRGQEDLHTIRLCVCVLYSRRAFRTMYLLATDASAGLAGIGRRAAFGRAVRFGSVDVAADRRPRPSVFRFCSQNEAKRMKRRVPGLHWPALSPANRCVTALALPLAERRVE